METSCPLCGRQKKMRGAKPLYDQLVCSKCYYGFANRRQLAFIIDWVLFQVFSIMVAIAFGIVVVMISQDSTAAEVLGWPLQFVLYAVFLCKDGFAGRSPGKLMCGVQVRDRESGLLIGFGPSFKRNLPLTIPLMVFIVAFQLVKGKRIGDGWAKTKVIWTRYADHPVFAVGANDASDPSAAQQAALAELTSMPLANDDGNPYQAPRL